MLEDFFFSIFLCEHFFLFFLFYGENPRRKKKLSRCSEEKKKIKHVVLISSIYCDREAHEKVTKLFIFWYITMRFHWLMNIWWHQFGICIIQSESWHEKIQMNFFSDATPRKFSLWKTLFRLPKSTLRVQLHFFPKIINSQNMKNDEKSALKGWIERPREKMMWKMRRGAFEWWKSWWRLKIFPAKCRGELTKSGGASGEIEFYRLHFCAHRSKQCGFPCAVHENGNFHGKWNLFAFVYIAFSPPSHVTFPPLFLSFFDEKSLFLSPKAARQCWTESSRGWARTNGKAWRRLRETMCFCKDSRGNFFVRIWQNYAQKCDFPGKFSEFHRFFPAFGDGGMSWGDAGWTIKTTCWYAEHVRIRYQQVVREREMMSTLRNKLVDVHWLPRGRSINSWFHRRLSMLWFSHDRETFDFFSDGFELAVVSQVFVKFCVLKTRVFYRLFLLEFEKAHWREEEMEAILERMSSLIGYTNVSGWMIKRNLGIHNTVFALKFWGLMTWVWNICSQLAMNCSKIKLVITLIRTFKSCGPKFCFVKKLFSNCHYVCSFEMLHV